MQRLVFLSLVCGLMYCFASANAMARINPWENATTPFNGPPAAIGEYANGCLSGAKALPLSGTGYQVIRSQNQRFYGHPQLIEFIEDYAKELQQLGVNNILVGDMSMPRGGQFDYGHNSHQIGLDVDIWLKLSEGELTPAQLKHPKAVTVVSQNQFNIDAKTWQPQHKLMLQTAASDDRVARIFVNAAIKQKLCQQRSESDTWLHKIRPWWGHSAHMHVRLACPQGDSQCQSQQPIAPGHGCDDIAWWKTQFLAAQAAPKKKPKANKKPQPKALKQKPLSCQPLVR